MVPDQKKGHEAQSTCIYCQQNKPISEFNIEHVIPSAFGDFPTRNMSPHLVSTVCTECNQFYGNTIDLFLARHSFEGIKRLEMGVKSDARGAHKQVYFEMKKLANDPNSPSPIFYMDRDRNKLDIAYGVRLYKKDNEKEFVNLLLDPRDSKHPTLSCIEPGVVFNPIEWKDDIGKFEIWCKDDDQQKLILSILDNWGINLRIDDASKDLIRNTVEEMQGNEEFTISAFVNREIYRAIAKILFNYAALNLGAEEMLKGTWDNCRKFIRFDKDDVKKRIDVTDVFWDTDPQNMTIETNAIDMRFENSNGNVIGKICFYGYWIYEIVLARNYTVSDDLLSGHRFVNGSKPIEAFRIKKGLGLYVPFIEKNDVGQIVRTFRKI